MRFRRNVLCDKNLEMEETLLVLIRAKLAMQFLPERTHLNDILELLRSSRLLSTRDRVVPFHHSAFGLSS